MKPATSNKIDEKQVKDLMEPYMKEIASVCMFSGKPILREELKEDSRSVSWFFQTIRVKMGEHSVRLYRRAYAVKTEELLKEPIRGNMLQDMLNVELDFTEIQNALVKSVREKEIRKAHEEGLKKELEESNEPGNRQEPVAKD